MDYLADGIPAAELPGLTYIPAPLAKLKDSCAWAEGTWDFGGQHRRWNGVQNPPNDMRVLTGRLLRAVR